MVQRGVGPSASADILYLLKDIFMSLVGFKGNSLLLEICSFVPGGLSKWRDIFIAFGFVLFSAEPVWGRFNCERCNKNTWFHYASLRHQVWEHNSSKVTCSSMFSNIEPQNATSSKGTNKPVL